MLAGRYEVMQTIASGGMGTVHLARVVGVGGFERLVAIKLMHAHFRAEPEFVSMFLDEARLAALIRHPNVVATIDVQNGDDGLFLVMEYVEGPSLKHLRRALWKRKERIPLKFLLRIFIDLLSGLHAAHEQPGKDGAALNLVHRDVSPPNILIGTDGVTRITDFGVARAETRLSSTRGGKLKGKLPYMPPEQIMSAPIDRRCDIYAAGVVLWEELTGERPFNAESEGALLHQILGGVRRRPRELVPDVPPAIDAVCTRAVAHDPNQRFASAADFMEALEEAAVASGIHVASARALATFVKGYELPSQPDASESSDSRQVLAPVPLPPALGTDSRAQASNVTVSAATISGLQPSRPRPPKRKVGLIVVAAVVVGVGVGVAMVGLSGGRDASTGAAPAKAADETGKAAASGADMAGADTASASPRADVRTSPPDVTEAEASSADALAPSASASAAPSAPPSDATTRVPPPAGRATPPRPPPSVKKAVPPPDSSRYDPSRL